MSWIEDVPDCLQCHGRPRFATDSHDEGCYLSGRLACYVHHECSRPLLSEEEYREIGGES